MTNLGWRLVLLLGVVFLSNTRAFAWGPNSNRHTAHSDISAYAVENSILNADNGSYLKKLGLTASYEAKLIWDVNEDGQISGIEHSKVIEWISDVGASKEDGNARELNHFYNPILNVGFGLWKGAPVWAQSSTAQVEWGSGPPPEDVPEMPLDWSFPDSTSMTDWSWQSIRSHFYSALTSMYDAARQAGFAKMFRGLGQQIHLLQDMSVPAHTRIDLHLFRDGLEEWAKLNIDSLEDLKSRVPAASIVMPTMQFTGGTSTFVPVARLFDTDSYHGVGPVSMSDASQGLAEWSSANFFSDDTINLPGYANSSSFPFPNEESTNVQVYLSQSALPRTVTAEDGIQDVALWIQKVDVNDNIEIEFYSKVGYTHDVIDPYVYDLSFSLDDACYKNYAEKLLPRAVGYSAALINYFFRGTLGVSAPDRCVYGIADGNAQTGGEYTQQFTELKAKVRNTTENEQLGPGKLVAVARYKVRNDYDPMLATGPSSTDQIAADYSYSVSDELTPDTVMLTSLNTVSTELTFTFSQTPIPVGVTDLHLNVVFKGTLGNEQDIAVAVGNVDLGDPRHHMFSNSTDVVYLDGAFYLVTELDSGQINRLAQALLPTQAFDLKTDVTYCPDAGGSRPPDVTYDVMHPAEYGRVITITDVDTTEYSFLLQRQTIDVSPPIGQEPVRSDTPGLTNHPIYTFRGTNFNAGMTYYIYYPTAPEGDIATQMPAGTPDLTPISWAPAVP